MRRVHPTRRGRVRRARCWFAGAALAYACGVVAGYAATRGAVLGLAPPACAGLAVAGCALLVLAMACALRGARVQRGVAVALRVPVRELRCEPAAIHVDRDGAREVIQ
jgi:hypothetical protein